MEQITLDFDSTGFEGFESCQHFFSYQAMTLKDKKSGVERPIKQGVQAM